MLRFMSRVGAWIVCQPEREQLDLWERMARGLLCLGTTT